MLPNSCCFRFCIGFFSSFYLSARSCSGATNLYTAGVKLGVFAEGESVSSLLPDPDFFLPTCYHDNPRRNLRLTLSKRNGDVWFQKLDASTYPDRLIPLQPPQLTPNLTGEYECRAPGQTQLGGTYQLKVIGKIKT